MCKEKKDPAVFIKVSLCWNSCQAVQTNNMIDFLQRRLFGVLGCSGDVLVQVCGAVKWRVCVDFVYSPLADSAASSERVFIEESESVDFAK